MNSSSGEMGDLAMGAMSGLMLSAEEVGLPGLD
jgi:hypothetical protein